MFLTFFDRIPQKPLRLIFHFEPSLISVERFPEKTPRRRHKVKKWSPPNCRKKNMMRGKWYEKQETSYFHLRLDEEL